MMNIKITISTLTFAFLLSGCGGGSAAPTVAPTVVPKVAAVPILSYTPVKGFKFDWTDVSDASLYKILENKNGVSGFSKIGNDIAQGVGTTTQIVPLHKRLNAQYILQSCTTTGCIDSAAISVTGTLVDSIGYVKASNTGSGDEFGSAVSLSSDGSTLAVGTVYEGSNASGVGGDQTDNTFFSSGAVYIFTLTGSMWTQQAYVKASNVLEEALFGNSVSLSSNGSTLAVGAEYEFSDYSGAAYIFTRTGSTWSEQKFLKASDKAEYDEFGSSVSLSGDGSTLAVGARVGDSAAAADSGVVYMFARTGTDWPEQQKVSASGLLAEDEFGYSVSLNSDGTTLAVGAPRESSDVTGIGAAYIFTRTGTSWSQQEKVVATSQGQEDYFGYSISLSGDGNTLAVGAKGEDSSAVRVGGNQSDNNASGSGAAYIFTRAGTAWSQQAYVKASNTGAEDEFGYSVSLSSDGSTLAVGARSEDSNATGLGGIESDNTANESGAVYTFSLTGTTWTQQAYVKATDAEGSDIFGESVSLSGDGSTLAVGAAGEGSNATGLRGNASDNSAGESGAVYLY